MTQNKRIPMKDADKLKWKKRSSVRLTRRGLSDDVEETIGRAVIETDSGDSNKLTNVALLMANFLSGIKEQPRPALTTKNGYNKYRNRTNQRPNAAQIRGLARSNGTSHHKTQRRNRPLFPGLSRQC